MKNSFVIYKNWATIAVNLPEELAGQLFKAICAMQLDEDYEITDPAIQAIFASIDQQMSEDNAKWEAKRERLAEAGKKGGEANAKQNEANAKQMLSDAKQNEAVNVNVNVNANDKDLKEKESKKKMASFVRPAREMVHEYFRELGEKDEAEEFCDHYDSNGWKVGGKTAMKDWKASVRQWVRRSKVTTEPRAPAKKNDFTNFDQRDYDFGELETQLLAR